MATQTQRSLSLSALKKPIVILSEPYRYSCPKCNTKLLVIHTPDGPHYGYINCFRHGKMWAPKPESEKKVTYKRNASLIASIPKEKNNYCWWCLRDAKHLKALKKRITLDVHHIIPKSENGSDDLSNLMVLCCECHKECHRRRETLSSYNTFVNERIGQN